MDNNFIIQLGFIVTVAIPLLILINYNSDVMERSI